MNATLKCSLSLTMRRSSNTYLVFAAATIFVTLYTLIHCHGFLVTIVKSFSMHPTLNRGDILLSTINADYNVNDIVLVQLSDTKVLCHRIISIKNRNEFLTKGDANDQDDRWLFPSGSFTKDLILGKVQGRIPWLGLPVLYVQETLWAKGLLLASWIALWKVSFTDI